MSELLEKIRHSINEYDSVLSRKLVEEALTRQVSPFEIVREISDELRLVGDKFSAGDLFLTDLIGAATAVQEAMELLREKMEGAKQQIKYNGTVIMGTVEGDIHTIGKNIVVSMLRANGFEVIDIGADQPVSNFVAKVKETRPDIVGASALLTSTMTQQRKLVDALREEGLRKDVRVIIGGAPVTKEWFEETGADGYARDSVEAVRVVENLLKR